MGRAVNKRELSEILGISERSLTDWQKEGMPVVEFGESRGQENTYDTEACIRWWIARDVARSSGSSSFDKLNDVRYRFELIKLRREENEIVLREDIRPAFRTYVNDALATLLGLPDKYAHTLELTESVDGKHQVLQDMIAEIRDVLGNYEFCAAPAAGGNSGVSQSTEDLGRPVG